MTRTNVRRVAVFTLGLALSMSMPAQAGWLDQIREWMGGAERNGQAPASATRPTKEQVMRAVSEGLSVAVQRAVQRLGVRDGYLGDPEVRIPMPTVLSRVEDLLRRFGQGGYADQFVASMNHAVERAVGEATPIFLDAIRRMSVHDARGIVSGPDDAATRYFETHTRAELHQAMLPMVRQATEETRVTAYYKRLMDRVERVGMGMVDTEPLHIDLDEYVTDRALDGLFVKLADEERRIREDPVARTTELLRKVFGRP